MKYAFREILLGFGFLAGMVSSGFAQLPTTTWVSGTGNDANPCSRALPCLTFQGALTKTAAGGEIRARDPGSYGAVTISKSITIDGAGVMANITAEGASPVFVNAGDNDVVILRNLRIDGLNTPPEGALGFVNGALLVIDRVRIDGFSGNGGIVVATGVGNGARNVVITNSTFSGTPSSHGIHVNRGTTYIRHSLITLNGGAALIAQGSGVIDAESNVIAFNGMAVLANGNASTTATIRLSNNRIYNNLTGIACGNGTVASAGNNLKAANVGGSWPVCSPTVVITQQ